MLETYKYEDWGNGAKKGTTVDSGEIREVDYSQGDLTGAEDLKGDSVRYHVWWRIILPVGSRDLEVWLY